MCAHIPTPRHTHKPIRLRTTTCALPPFKTFSKRRVVATTAFCPAAGPSFFFFFPSHLPCPQTSPHVPPCTMFVAHAANAGLNTRVRCKRHASFAPTPSPLCFFLLMGYFFSIRGPGINGPHRHRTQATQKNLAGPPLVRWTVLRLSKNTFPFLFFLFERDRASSPFVQTHPTPPNPDIQT